jgi:hypothetical protein
VLFVGLVHDLLAHGLSNRGVEEFFLDRGVDFELGERLANDFLFRGPALGRLELIEQSLTRAWSSFRIATAGLVLKMLNMVLLSGLPSTCPLASSLVARNNARGVPMDAFAFRR